MKWNDSLKYYGDASHASTQYIILLESVGIQSQLNATKLPLVSQSVVHLFWFTKETCELIKLFLTMACENKTT